MNNPSDKVWTVLSMLEWATGFFEKKGVDSPRMSVEWLLADTLNIRRLDLYLQFDRPLSDKELDQLRPLIKRRALHEPLQHITGNTDFLGCTISVNPHVLIPRPETEQLVELVLDHFSENPEKPLRLLDIGTGSGCIPISIKKMRPSWSCTGIDISERALETARLNASSNEAEVNFLHCDLLEIDTCSDVSSSEWDIIISNPPYITHPERNSMEKQVTEYEPEMALFHDDPNLLYKTIAGFAEAKKSALFFECNARFASEILTTVKENFPAAKLLNDYGGKGRFIVAEN